MKHFSSVATFIVGLTIPALVATSASAQTSLDALGEAGALQVQEARESGRPAYSPATAVKFSADDNVFVKSALGINFTYRAAFVTLPLFRGLSPQGDPVDYIITESSDFDVAKKMGLNYSPKMKYAAGAGSQTVGFDGGVMRFKGSVDFSPERMVVPGLLSPFPPRVAKPGGVADAQWSSMVVMPSGDVLNVQVMHNASGTHDRVKSIDMEKRTVTVALLDGFQGGKQYFYHMVTDVSAELPATLENGVFSSRLALVPAYGQSTPVLRSALLGFSPVVNGIIDTSTHQDQGFADSINNGGIDPINVFPVGPDNDNRSQSNNYSPLWDAHISMWTPAGIAAGKVRRITSFEDLQKLVKAGYVTSAADNPAGPGNAFVAGLRPSQAIVNCPVIAHPKLRAQ